MVIMREGRRSVFKILTDKLTGRRFLGRPRRKWKCNIKNRRQSKKIDSAQDRGRWRVLVNAALNIRVP